MLEIVDFQRGHLDGIDPIERNGREKLQGVADILTHFSGFTMLKDGRPVGSAGLIPIHPQRYAGWSIISRETPVFPAARLVKEFLDKQDVFRIETTVDCGDVACERWVRFLGFVPETPPLEGYNVDGSSARLFVRLRNGACSHNHRSDRHWYQRCQRRGGWRHAIPPGFQAS